MKLLELGIPNKHCYQYHTCTSGTDGFIEARHFSFFGSDWCVVTGFHGLISWRIIKVTDHEHRLTKRTIKAGQVSNNKKFNRK